MATVSAVFGFVSVVVQLVLIVLKLTYICLMQRDVFLPTKVSMTCEVAWRYEDESYVVVTRVNVLHSPSLPFQRWPDTALGLTFSANNPYPTCSLYMSRFGHFYVQLACLLAESERTMFL